MHVHHSSSEIMRKAEYVAWYLILFASLWMATRGIEARFGYQAGHWAAIVVVMSVYITVGKRRHRWLAWYCGWAARSAVNLVLTVILRRWWHRIFRIRDETTEIDGVAVWISSELTPRDLALVPRIGDALATLRAIQPSRRERIDWFGVQLAVVSLGYLGGAWLDGIGVIAIDPRVLEEAPGVIASLLVHELNHARVGNHGPINGLIEHRAERLARLDQYNFAVRLLPTDRAAATRIRDIVMAPYPVGFMAKMARVRAHHRMLGAAGQGGATGG